MGSLDAQSPSDPSRRPSATIALLIDRMNLVAGGFEQEMRSAFHLECQAQGIQLCLIYGRAVDPSSVESIGHNAIFDHVGIDTVSAAIVLSTSLSPICGRTGLLEFLRRLDPLPIVSIGLALPGIPSVVVDAAEAMSLVVEHLIVEHGRSRLAFIGGPPDNPEAQERLSAYQDTLVRHGLTSDPRLIVYGNFVRTGGQRAVRELLASGLGLDGIVAANDSMAFGAMDELRSQGLRVGATMSLTGFDDIEAARMCNPPLTTVSQPYVEIARSAIALALDQVRGRPVADRVSVAPSVVVRTSCGCRGGLEIAARRDLEAQSLVRVEASSVGRGQLIKTLTTVLEHLGPFAESVAQRLVVALEEQQAGSGDALLTTIEAIVSERPADAGRIVALDSAIRMIRSRSSIGVQDELWHQLRDYLVQCASAAQMNLALELHASHLKLVITNERLSGVLELQALRAELDFCSRVVGLSSAMIARALDEAGTSFEPLLCIRNGAILHGLPDRVAAVDVMSGLANADGSTQTSLVFPLAMGAKCLGIAIFGYQPQVRGYVQFRDQVAVALRNVALHDSLVEQTLLHERSAQERLATANRLQAMGMLAGSVAHDLNNALGPLVALPDILEGELEQWSAESNQKEEFLTDVATIRVASMRATQIVKDLLTLGRQGRTAKVPLDLNAVVRRHVEPEIARIQRTDSVNVQVDISYMLPSLNVLGSEAQLARALSNLIRNAFESVVMNGVISIELTRVVIENFIVGYERIEPGAYALLRVVDNGVGIPKLQLSRIFEPYFSSKRASNESGSGLGLAIVHGVVKEHDGFIDVVSTVGQGTSFSIYLPVTEERVNEHVSSAPAHSRGARIWVVDDDPVQLRTAGRVLASLGFEVEAFERSELLLEAMQRLRDRSEPPCDLLLLDMCLGEDRDGLALLDQIHALVPSQRAMIVSGYAPTDRAKLAEYKGLTWLVKPYTSNSLSAAIVAALR